VKLMGNTPVSRIVVDASVLASALLDDGVVGEKSRAVLMPS
jgi:hypothetical protein